MTRTPVRRRCLSNSRLSDAGTCCCVRNSEPRATV